MKRKPEEEASRSGITTLPIVPGTLILCAALLAAFFLLFFALYRAGVVSLPSFIDNIFHTHVDGGQSDTFSDEFLASLKGHSPLEEASDTLLLDLSDDALRDLLLAAEITDSYYQSLEITWTNEAETFTKSQVFLLASGERVYAEVFTSEHSLKHLICDADTFFLREGRNSRHFSRNPGSDTLTPQSEIGIPSLSRMQKILREAEAGTYTLSLETVLQAACIRVSYTDAATGVREVFDVLPDCGLIVNAASYLPGAASPYYLLQTKSVMTDISGYDESIFEIPDPIGS